MTTTSSVPFFLLYNYERSILKRILLDRVPTWFSAKLEDAYGSLPQSVQQAQCISERLKETMPFLGQKNVSTYWMMDEKDRDTLNDAVWRVYSAPRKLSELVDLRLIDCNVLSLATAQVFANTQVLHKMKSTTTGHTLTRHTFCAHPYQEKYYCVDLVATHKTPPTFFEQDSISCYEKARVCVE
jgi:hypothetical protein